MKTHEQLLAEVNDPNREELQPGTPAYRLRYLLDGLAARFPNAVNQFSSDVLEEAYLEAIDDLMKDYQWALDSLPQTLD